MAGTDGRDSKAGSQRRRQQEEGAVPKLRGLSGVSKQTTICLIFFEGQSYVKNKKYGLAAHVTDSCVTCRKCGLL